MQKKADKNSNEYYQGALSELGDQYAKSYYTGLKGMYDEKPKKTEADFAKLYEIHNGSGSDLIGTAHPYSVSLAESMGNGGLVENQIEKQRAGKNVALSMPTGNFRGKHAYVIKSLVKLADSLDSSGMAELSDLIDEAINNISSNV